LQINDSALDGTPACVLQEAQIPHRVASVDGRGAVVAERRLEQRVEPRPVTVFSWYRDALLAR
jgi:hypothetical protein